MDKINIKKSERDKFKTASDEKIFEDFICLLFFWGEVKKERN